jgi:hypothetical protein
VESTLSKREPRVKLWKGSHVGAVWGWEPYSGTATRRSSIVVVSRSRCRADRTDQRFSRARQAPGAKADVMFKSSKVPQHYLVARM